MSKVRTLSRKFMSGHPRKGQCTNFVEKVLISLGTEYLSEGYFLLLQELNPNIPVSVLKEFHGSLMPMHDPKHHTIRGGSHFNVGDKISLRVWSGKPYQSKQIIIAPDIEVKKVWPVEIEFFGGSFYVQLPVKKNHWTLLSAGDVAKNDGLEVHDFIDWFKVHPKSKAFNFKGQIICWDESVIY